MPTDAKRRTNVTLDRALTEARDWAWENAEALAERAVWIEDRGLPLAPWQVLMAD